MRMMARTSRLIVGLLIGVVVVAFVGVAMTFARRAQAGGELSSTPDAKTGARLQAIGGQFLKESATGSNAVASSATADVIPTTQEVANDLFSPGTRVYQNTPVYAVQIQGSFTANLALVPPGAKAPTGAALWFLYDPVSDHVTDWGLRPEPADLSALGPVTELHISEVTAT